MQSSDRLQGLSQLKLPTCCDWPYTELTSGTPVQSIGVDMLNEQPVLRVVGDYGLQQTLKLASGVEISFSDAKFLDRVGRNYASNRGWNAPDAGTWIQLDQWTVSGEFDPHRPLRKFSNEAGNDWYVSSLTGEVVQVTRRAQRFWNWLGAVPHWLYPTLLRQHTVVWAQVVIWATLISLFLTITGIVIGIKHYRWRSTPRQSPYSGWMLWHHLAGLLFGVVTLTWLASGLLSMNPWGALESRDFSAERNAINAGNSTIEEVLALLDSTALPAETVQVRSVNFLGGVNLLTYDRNGNITRFSDAGQVGEVTEAEMAAAAAAMRTEEAMISYLTDGDAYYYSHHETREFPVFRLRYNDGEYFYVSASTGQLVAAFDASRKTYRWLFAALHQGDFHERVRHRPVWDIMMLCLLLGTTAGVGTGTYIGLRRAFS
jgi:hypothetical protein